MAATTPATTDLVRDTDLFIRKTAEYAEAKLNGSTKIAVSNAADYTTNSSGDIGVPFPTIVTITGCVLYVCGSTGVTGKTTSIPSGGQIPYQVPPFVPWLQMVAFNAGGSLVWARVMCPAYMFAPTAYIGAQPAAANQKVKVAGIAWGPG